MDKKEELKKLFHQVDENDDGKISLEEFREFLRRFDSGYGTEEVVDIGFDIVDKNNNEEIDFDEFYDWWSDM